MRNCGLATQTIRKTGFNHRLFPCEALSSFVHVRGVMISANLREIKPGFLIPTMKSIDQPKKQEKAKELPEDFECACNTCPSKEACKAAQEAEKAAP